MTENRKKIFNLIFDPFGILSLKQSLYYGIAIIFISGLLNSISNTHFDGILDIHTGKPAPLLIFILEGFINLIVVSVVFFTLIKISLTTHVSFFEIFSQQSFARWPFILISFLSLSQFYQDIIRLIYQKYIELDKSVIISSNDFNLFLIILLIMMIISIWSLILMYNSFRRACDKGGIKVILLFITGIIISEILSKFIFLILYDFN